MPHLEPAPRPGPFQLLREEKKVLSQLIPLTDTLVELQILVAQLLVISVQGLLQHLAAAPQVLTQRHHQQPAGFVSLVLFLYMANSHYRGFGSPIDR